MLHVKPSSADRKWSTARAARTIGGPSRAPASRHAWTTRSPRAASAFAQADAAFLALEQAADIGVVAQDDDDGEREDDLGRPHVARDEPGIERRQRAGGERRQR